MMLLLVGAALLLIYVRYNVGQLQDRVVDGSKQERELRMELRAVEIEYASIADLAGIYSRAISELEMRIPSLQHGSLIYLPAEPAVLAQ